jgi:hypothetical protein
MITCHCAQHLAIDQDHRPSYNSAPKIADTTIIAAIPIPALLTPCVGTPSTTAAFVVAPGEAPLPAPLGFPLPPAPELVSLGFPVAVAVLFPEQNINCGLTPPS